MPKFIIESREEEDGEVVLWGTRENNSPSAWNFYMTKTRDTELVLPEDADIPACYNRCTSWKEFSTAKGEYWLAQPAVKINVEQYDDALDCLPPLCWERFETGGERFILSEAQDGPYHSQFYIDRRTGHGLRRYVHLRNRDTWITAEDLRKAYE